MNDFSSQPESPSPENPYQPPQRPAPDLPTADIELTQSTQKWNWPLVIASWVVILLLSSFLCFMAAASNAMQEETREVSQMDLGQANWMAKYTVGTFELFNAVPDARTLDTGFLEQRFCQAIVINELEGSEKAKEYLSRLSEKTQKAKFEKSNEQIDMERALKNVFSDHAEGEMTIPSLTEFEKQELVDRLGWCGELAITPKGSPDVERREKLMHEATFTTAGTLAFFGAFVLAIITGFFVAISAGVLLFMGKLRRGMSDDTTNGGIYVETFALWMVLFLAMQFGIGLASNVIPNPQLFVVFGFFGTLIALAWPPIRGVRWSTMLREVGLAPVNIIKEACCGVLAYLASIPFLGAAIVVVGILIFLTQGTGGNEFAPPRGPSHPVVDDIANSDSWLPMIQIVLMTCVAAPIVEEIVFRGLLFRHLRELTFKWKLVISVVFSSVINGLLFAMIHPQGLVAVPVLATLAIAFCLAREWRGSLVAPMTMHAINNGAITCMMLLMLT